VIPVEDSSLYVVPPYLKAEGTNFAQLKRRRVAAGDKVVMEPTLDAGSSQGQLATTQNAINALK